MLWKKKEKLEQVRGDQKGQGSWGTGPENSRVKALDRAVPGNVRTMLRSVWQEQEEGEGRRRQLGEVVGAKREGPAVLKRL